MSKKISFVPVENANEFVGIEIKDDKINLRVPRVFREEKESRHDALLFLKSLALANTFEKEYIKNGANNTKNVWPIHSYLWIINDYLENGFYYKREKTYFHSNSGKIDWKRTMRQVPIYSNGNVIYDKLVTSRMSASDDLISHIYKMCLKQSLDRIGWLFNYNFVVEVNQFISINEMIALVKKELNETFDDVKRLRFRHMLKILSTTEGDKMLTNQCSYGITNYYYVFERMVDSLFDGLKGDEKKKYNPNGYWKLNGVEKVKVSSLRPDTIMEKNDKIYILDAKMYQYGVTHDIRDLPDTQSLQKQITYGDYVFNTMKKEHIRNAFIIPYDKELEVFKNDNNLVRYMSNNLVYFGYAFVDWRDDKTPREYDNIFTFGIDFNYLLNNYNHADSKMICELCESIEEKVKQ